MKLKICIQDHVTMYNGFEIGLHEGIMLPDSDPRVLLDPTAWSDAFDTIEYVTNAPAIAGALGDICIRRNPGGASQTIYRCSVAGAAGVATWVGIL